MVWGWGGKHPIQIGLDVVVVFLELRNLHAKKKQAWSSSNNIGFVMWLEWLVVELLLWNLLKMHSVGIREGCTRESGIPKCDNVSSCKVGTGLLITHMAENKWVVESWVGQPKFQPKVF